MDNLLSNLKPAQGSVKNKKRIGRGSGSGRGGTSTRGHKGAKSRSGYSQKRNHEGGQTPIQMRLPKRGFKNINRVDYVALNLGKIQELADKYEVTTLDLETLLKLRIIKRSQKVKVLGSGELNKVMNISAHAFSASAKEAIENMGGTATIL